MTWPFDSSLGEARNHLALTHDIYIIPSFADPTNDYRFMFYGALDITFGLAFKNEWHLREAPKR